MLSAIIFMYQGAAPTSFLYEITFRFILFTNFNAQFFYSLTICMLHYYPLHFSSINMPIFRRTNCIITTSALIRHTVQPFTESDSTKCCDNTICPPEYGHVNARNMSKIVM